MDGKKRTTLVIWSAVGILLTYDLYCVMTDPETTISAVVSDASKRWPIIAAAFGILVGHLFFPIKVK